MFRFARFAAALALPALALPVLALSGCTGALDGLDPGRGEQANPPALVALMAAKKMDPAAPVMFRIFKEENVLEVWKRRESGRYALLKSYEICKWSGKLGPKRKEGDKQAPEGVYEFNRHLLNPASSYYLSINLGFPNSFDRSHDRTGSFLMIHGACSSAGCYAMTDPQALEIYNLARDAMRGGQKRVQVQAFPFRMTAANMARHRDHAAFDFWRMLKPAYDTFELTRRPPRVHACGGQYVFNMHPTTERALPRTTARAAAKAACPPMGMKRELATRLVKRMDRDRTRFEAMVAKAEGRPPVARAPLTFAKAFPGVTLLGEQEAPEAAPEVAAPDAAVAAEAAGAS